METINFDTKTVGEIVAHNPKAASVFRKLNIDFCCGGNKSFTEECKKKKQNPAEIWEEIELLSNTGDKSLDFNNLKLDFLIDYIYNVHHQFLYKNLPEIRYFVEKVYTKHKDKYAYLTELATVYKILEEDLLSHLPKEENVIFPYGKSLVTASEEHAHVSPPFFRTVKNPISMMNSEHEEAGELLFRLREITNNYTPPEDACNSHIVMLSKLEELDSDLTQHVHLENNILFPKLTALEKTILEN